MCAPGVNEVPAFDTCVWSLAQITSLYIYIFASASVYGPSTLSVALNSYNCKLFVTIPSVPKLRTSQTRLLQGLSAGCGWFISRKIFDNSLEERTIETRVVGHLKQWKTLPGAVPICPVTSLRIEDTIEFLGRFFQRLLPGEKDCKMRSPQ